MARPGQRRTPAFTLVELLVVILIVLLVSAVTLPTVLPALSHRQVSEAARILQAQLVQTRDTAIRFNAPRGVRFLPDPTYANSPTILAYNRMVPLEPGPEYSNGQVVVWPVPNPQVASAAPVPTPPPYPIKGASTPNAVYPYYPNAFAPTLNPGPGQVLMVEQAPWAGNTVGPSNFLAPTSWFWNVRLGDKIQIGNEGQSYTVVGPCTINPISGVGGNPELFVNVGSAGDTTNYLVRTYTDALGNATQTQVEFLYLVNGYDDAQTGYVDSGFDGVTDWGIYSQPPLSGLGAGDQVADNLFEWQPEVWRGVIGKYGLLDPANLNFNAASTNSVTATAAGILPPPTPYTISRRPVPAQAAREVMFPNNVVVDATTWNSTPERSRLPVDQFSKYVDIVLLPTGQVVPTTLYSAPTSFTLGDSFYHFWLSERQDVHETTDLWGAVTNPNAGLAFKLPMPQDAYNAYGLANFATMKPAMALTGERMMVTLFSRTGQITINTVEFFNVSDVNTPFYDSQLGAREGN